VVLNEHTLGYILPELPDSVQVLHLSILKGAPFELYPDSKMISSNDKVRLASEQDFDDFRVSFDGFRDNDKYEYSNNI
ncbi:MAG: hypothetical protein LBL79_08850, partial [Prevotella sp.]|nr:hypothetical protein [Prevotella sp.]